MCTPKQAIFGAGLHAEILRRRWVLLQVLLSRVYIANASLTLMVSTASIDSKSHPGIDNGAFGVGQLVVVHRILSGAKVTKVNEVCGAAHQMKYLEIEIRILTIILFQGISKLS